MSVQKRPAQGDNLTSVAGHEVTPSQNDGTPHITAWQARGGFRRFLRTGEQMPPPEIGEIDFSEFHPLDHWPWERRCRDLPGGRRNHLEMAWRYRWSVRVRRMTLCQLGWHRWCQAWSRQRGNFTVCWNCGREPG